MLETGWFERGPDGRRLLPEGWPSLELEASFQESLRIATRLGARRTVFTHIEEINQRTPEEYEDLARTPELSAVRGSFAHDGLRIRIGGEA